MFSISLWVHCDPTLVNHWLYHPQCSFPCPLTIGNVPIKNQYSRPVTACWKTGLNAYLSPLAYRHHRMSKPITPWVFIHICYIYKYYLVIIQAHKFHVLPQLYYVSRPVLSYNQYSANYQVVDLQLYILMEVVITNRQPLNDNSTKLV